MKTSLQIDDALFREARQESLKTGKTVSEIISFWAKHGRSELRKAKSSAVVTFKPVNLGGPAKIDLTSRKNWIDALDDQNS